MKKSTAREKLRTAIDRVGVAREEAGFQQGYRCGRFAVSKSYEPENDRERAAWDVVQRAEDAIERAISAYARAIGKHAQRQEGAK